MASPSRRRISTPSNSASPSRARSPAAYTWPASVASVSSPSPPSTRTRSYPLTLNVAPLSVTKRRPSVIASSSAVPSTISVRFTTRTGSGPSTNSRSPARVRARWRSPPISFANARARSASALSATSSRRPSWVTEPPNSRSRASSSSSSPSRRSWAVTLGTSSRIAFPPDRGSNVSTDCWPKRSRIVSAIVCSSSSSSRSTSNTRERSNVVVPSKKNTPSSSSDPRGRAPPSSMIRSTARSKPFRRSCSRGSAGSVITAVLLVAKISASSCAAAAGASNAVAVSAAARIPIAFMRAQDARAKRFEPGNPRTTPIRAR